MRPGTIATRGVLAEVLLERVRQDAKFGADRDHPSVDQRVEGFPTALAMRYGVPHEAFAKETCERAFREGRGTWADIAVEEVAEAIGAEDEQARRAELVQCAAVFVAWIEAIDRRAGMAIAPHSPMPSKSPGGAWAYLVGGHLELGCEGARYVRSAVANIGSVSVGYVREGCACDPTPSDERLPAPVGRPRWACEGSLPSLAILEERPAVPE